MTGGKNSKNKEERRKTSSLSQKYRCWFVGGMDKKKRGISENHPRVGKKGTPRHWEKQNGQKK